MIDEHGLISVNTLRQQAMPGGAKLFLPVDRVLRRVTKIIVTSRGDRAVVRMPAGNQRIPVEADTLLVIAYCDLATELAEPIIKASRLARLPLKEIPRLNFIPSNYAGVHCG